MQYTREQSDGSETITLAGELTISSADELKEVLINTLSVNDHIALNLEQVTEVDLSFLQLLCSTHRTAIKMIKTLIRTGTCPESLKKIAEHSGYARHMGCEKNCLWAGMHEINK